MTRSLRSPYSWTRLTFPSFVKIRITSDKILRRFGFCGCFTSSCKMRTNSSPERLLSWKRPFLFVKNDLCWFQEEKPSKTDWGFNQMLLTFPRENEIFIGTLVKHWYPPLSKYISFMTRRAISKRQQTGYNRRKKRRVRKCSSCKLLKTMSFYKPIILNGKKVMPKTCQTCRDKRTQYYWSMVLSDSNNCSIWIEASQRWIFQFGHFQFFVKAFINRFVYRGERFLWIYKS